MRPDEAITLFMGYMAGQWGLSKCSRIFGSLGAFMWGKWIDCDRRADAFFFAIDSDCRARLIARALEYKKQTI